MQDRELREVGLKVTAPRLKILQILESANARHLSAEDVFKRLTEQNEDVALATVYRVLTQFEIAGLVRRHNFEGGHSVYELNTGDHHDHMVCVSCATVTEFYDDLIEQQQERVAKKYGFIVKDHDHIIYGICKNCQKS